MSIRIAHLMNPLVAPRASDLEIAQPVTFDAIRRAVASAAYDDIGVQVLSAQFEEDHAAVPDFAFKTDDLTRSALDVVPGTSRKLPFLSDLLDRLCDRPSDIYIYTNVDIAPRPDFYRVVTSLVTSGTTAGSITRRTVPPPRHPADVAISSATVGRQHRGHDCFFFASSVTSGFDVGSLLVGADGVGRGLMWNLALATETFTVLRDLHVTFHLGDDRLWRAHDAVNVHNAQELHALLARFRSRYGEATIERSLAPYLGSTTTIDLGTGTRNVSAEGVGGGHRVARVARARYASLSAAFRRWRKGRKPR